MRSIEEKIDIPESRKGDFRHELMNYIAAVAAPRAAPSTTARTSAWRARSSSRCSRTAATRSSSRACVSTRRRPRHAGEDRGDPRPADARVRLRRGRAPTRCCSTWPALFARGEAKRRPAARRPPERGGAERVFRIEATARASARSCAASIRADLRKYLSTSELIGAPRRARRLDPGAADRAAALPLRRERQAAASARARARRATPVDGEDGEGEGEGAAGEQPGTHILEVEVELDELAEMLGRGARAAQHPAARPQASSPPRAGATTACAAPARDSLRHFRRTYRAGAASARSPPASGTPSDPRVVPDRARTTASARARARPQPDSSAVIFHMMDVSGSMGREQKDIVRIKAFWIDTWLRSQYKNLEVVYIVHDAVAKVVDQETFFHLRESGGTKISSAYELCLKLIQEKYRPEDWNIYPFHYSDGDNWSARDTERCIAHPARRAPAARQPVLLRAGEERLRLGPVQEGPRRRARPARSAGHRRASPTATASRGDPRLPRARGASVARHASSGRALAGTCRRQARDRSRRVAREARPRLLRGRLRAARRRATSTASRPTAASRCATRSGASAWSTSASRRATSWGLSKIYELVINNDPSYAYLVRSNSTARAEAGHGARLRPRRLLQAQRAGSRPPTGRCSTRWRTTSTRVRALHRRARARGASRRFLDRVLSLDNLVDPLPAAARR